MTGHLFTSAGRCCQYCGVRQSDALPRLVGPGDPRGAECPGGPGSNIIPLTHVIAMRRIAAQLDWDRPFKAPPL